MSTRTRPDTTSRNWSVNVRRGADGQLSGDAAYLPTGKTCVWDCIDPDDTLTAAIAAVPIAGPGSVETLRAEVLLGIRRLEAAEAHAASRAAGNGRAGAAELNVEDKNCPSPLPPPKRLADLPAPEPQDFLIEGIVVQREVNAVVGDGDAGKSTILYAGAGAVAAGALAYGERSVRPGPVLFVSGEDSADLIRNRIEALAAAHGWPVPTTLENLYVYDEGVDLDDLRWQLRLVEAARDVRAVLACFDPLSDLCGDRVEENSNTDARRVINMLRTFMRASGATPWLAMHVAKPAEGKTERKHRVRGASAWRNATRLCYWVEKCEGGIELDPIKANRLARPKPLYLRLTVTADPDHPLMWQAAHLALDTQGDVVTAEVLAVVRYVAESPAPPTGSDVEAGDHGVPRDRVRTHLQTARRRGWLEYREGGRTGRAHLWSVTHAGQARLLLGEGPER